MQPPLGSRDWRYVAVTPTEEPFEALSSDLCTGLARDCTCLTHPKGEYDHA